MNLKKIHFILFLKPCYKRTAFNTEKHELENEIFPFEVLNLIITGIPSILWKD